MARDRSVIFSMFPLEGQQCPEKPAASPGKDFLDQICGGRANSGLSVLLSPPALSGHVKDLLFQFCSTAAIERRQRVIYVAARRLVSPPPVAVHRMLSLLEDEGTPAPHRLKFIYPRSFSQLMAYFSALSGLREPALPDAIVIDGLENFVELSSDDFGGDDENDCVVSAAVFEEMRDGRLTRALSLLQEFSAGWSQLDTGERGDCDGRRRRKPVSVVVGYSADWRDSLSLERRMAAFCREVWTLECLGKRKGAGEDSEAVTLRLKSRVEEKCLFSMEVKLVSVKGTSVLFPGSLVVEKSRVGA